MRAYLGEVAMEQDNKEHNQSADLNAEAPSERVSGPWTTFKKRLLKKDGKRFKKYIESTSTNGVAHIFIGKSVIRRLFWLVIVLGAAGVCLYLITGKILHLAAQHTATTKSVSRPDTLTFPVLTVCNLNFVRCSSYLESLHMSEALNRILEGEGLSQDGFNVSRCTTKVIDEYIKIKETFGVNVSLEFSTTVEEGRNFFEVFVLECSYQGVDCKDLPYDPWNKTLTSLGLCYTFNTGKAGEPLTVNSTGTRHGLKLVLNIQQDEYTALAESKAGVKLSVHPQGTPGEPDEKGIAIPPGRNAFISLKERRINDKSSNTNCRKRIETDSFNFIGSEYQYYSITACTRDCLLSSIAENCGCIESPLLNSGDEYTGISSTLPVCDEQQFCCVLGVHKSARGCGMVCPSSCSYTEYTQAVSYSAFPANYLTEPLISRLEFLLRNKTTAEDTFSPDVVQSLDVYDNVTIDRDFLKQNLLSVNIYFEYLNFETEVTEDAYSVPALLSDIGGQLGLFVGVSIISMIEFVIWIIDELKERCCGINEKIIREWLRTAWRRVTRKISKTSSTADIELGNLDQGGKT